MPQHWYDALPRKQYESFIRLRTPDPWFEVYQIFPDIYAIYENKHFQEVISYLITGSEKALLIDTGLGIGNIKAVTDSLWNGELTVVHTHTHFDHIGGDCLFPQICTPDHPVAIARAQHGLSHEEVADNMVAGSNAAPYPQGFDPEAYCIRPANSFTTFRENDIFDLGTIALEVIETPGHSPDSVMFADHGNRRLFTGDTFYPATLYAHITHNDGSDSDFETYRQTMHTLADRFAGYTLITSHNEPLRPGIELQKAAQAFDAITTGQLDFIEDDRKLKKYTFEDFCIVTQ